MLERIARNVGNFLEEGVETSMKTAVYFGMGIIFKTAHMIYCYEGIDLRRDMLKE